MTREAVFIGFGEAGAAFARAGDRGYDRKLDRPSERPAMLEAFAAAGVRPCADAAAALAGADVALCLVTADQALAAAREDAGLLPSGALWCDMNSVAPQTKRAAAAAVEPAARYVDVAVMSPVHPGRRRTPLLVSGPHAAAAVDALRALDFADVRAVGSRVGDASAIKMIRSVMVKGLEALSAECALAAEAAGVRAEVIASLDASWPGADWGRRFDYNLDRMMVHGRRRAAEMQEVTLTLEALGVAAPMTRATTERQQALGALELAPPAGLDAKLAALSTAAARLENAA